MDNMIKENAVGMETRQIRRDFTDEQIIVLQEKFTQNEIAKAAVEDEFTEVKKDFNGKISDFKSISKGLRTQLRDRFIDETIDVYAVPNHDTGMMEFCHTETGEVLDSRKLRPTEKQLQITSKVG